MKTVIESKLFPWIAGLVVGALMGFVVGPWLTALVLHEYLSFALRTTLAIIASGLVGLVIEIALSRRAPAVDPDRKQGEVDKVFGIGRVTYTVTPNPESGRIQFNIFAHGIGGRRFHDKLLPMLIKIDGIEWGKPSEPGTGAQRKALKRYTERRDAIAQGLVAEPPIDLVRTISGVITPEASLANVITKIEDTLGGAQPL